MDKSDRRLHLTTSAMVAGVIALIGVSVAEQFRDTRGQITAEAKPPSQVWDGKADDEITKFVSNVGAGLQRNVIDGVVNNAICAKRDFPFAKYEIQVTCSFYPEYAPERAEANITIKSNNGDNKSIHRFAGFSAPGIHGLAIY